MIDKLWLKYGKEIHRDDNKHYEIKSVSINTLLSI